MAYTGKKPIDHTDVTQSQSMTVTDDLTVDTDTLYVDSTNNNVGIGTSTPTQKLTVANGYGIFEGIKVGQNGTDIDSTFLGANSLLTFKLNGTERMRIDSSGHVGIGLTNPAYPVDVKSTTNGDIIFKATHQGSGSVAFHGNYISSSGTSYFGWWKYNGSVVGSITSTGSSTAYNTSSDYRLKENVTGITDGIERVKQLNPSRFNFIADAEKTVDGFIAHEAQTVVPEAVHGEKDAVDGDGNPEYQGIDQAKLVPLLTAALQEAITKIETLEAQNADFETRLTALEAE